MTRASHVLFGVAAIAALAALAACLGEDPSLVPAGTDAGEAFDGGAVGTDTGAPDAPASGDASTPARCDPAKDFGEPTLVVGVSSAEAEASARLTADEKTIFFTRIGDGGLPVLLAATRNSTSAPFAEKDIFSPLTTTGGLYPSPSSTGDELYFVRTSGVGGDDVLVAQRDGGLYANSTRISISTDLNETHPFARADDKALYFVYQGNEPYRTIHRSLIGGGNYSSPEPLSLPNDADNLHPAVTADGTTVYFARMIPTGHLNIFVARGADRDVGPPLPVVELNIPGTDTWPSWVSPDGCVLYFTSIRADGAGKEDIYMAQKPK